MKTIQNNKIKVMIKEIKINALRILAWVLDMIICILGLFPFTLIILMFMTGLYDYKGTIILISYMILYPFIYAIYHFVLWRSRSKTFGQSLIKLRLQSLKSSAPTLFQCLLKTLIASMPLFLGSLQIFFNIEQLNKILSFPILLIIYCFSIKIIDKIIGINIVREG